MNPNFQRGLLLYQQGRYQQAETELRKGLALAPEHGTSHAFLALCLAEQQQFEKATEEAQLSIRYEPDSDFGYYALARVMSDRGYYEEAMAHANEAVRLDSSDPENFCLLASIAFSQRAWPAALEAADRGLQCNPEHVGCANLRAMALVKLGRGADAARTIEGALSKAPDNSLTHANKGWALLHESNHKEALEHFREALRLDPDNEWARQGVVQSLKARHFIYAWMLRYFLWMSRLSGRAQWGVIMGAYIGNRALTVVADSNPQIAPWIWPIKILYLIFVVLTWTADPLFNLLLRLNRFGRLALSREQIVASNWLGATILFSLVCLGGFFLTRNPILELNAIIFGCLILPIAGIFKCWSGWPRWVMVLYTIALLITGEAAIFSRKGADFVSIFIVGIFLSGWIANGLMAVREKR
jgi:tetratricopeptide (TPR) repeat protein